MGNVVQKVKHLGHRTILQTVLPSIFIRLVTATQSPICEANATASVMYITSILRGRHCYGNSCREAEK